MSIFRKNKIKRTVPEECRGLEIKIESSVCTGEKVIGFFEPETKKLLYSELVESQKDIDSYYKKYGAEKTQIK